LAVYVWVGEAGRPICLLRPGLRGGHDQVTAGASAGDWPDVDPDVIYAQGQRSKRRPRMRRDLVHTPRRTLQ